MKFPRKKNQNQKKAQEMQKKRTKAQQKEEQAMGILFAADRSQKKWVTVTDQTITNHSNTEWTEDPTDQGEERKRRVIIMDKDLKERKVYFDPMKFTPQEKSLLRDNMTAVLRKDIKPKFVRVSHDHVKVGAYLGVALRLVHKEHAYKIKRIAYDRPLLHNGLLYFIDGLDRNGKDSFHIWLLVRLVCVREENAFGRIEAPDPVYGMSKKTQEKEARPLCAVHDMFCKNCRHRKPCNYQFKGVQQISEYTIGLYVKMPVKLEGAYFLYAVVLNSPTDGALSSRFFLSAASKKQAEREQKKEKKERRERGEESDSSFSESGSGMDLGKSEGDDLSYMEASDWSFAPVPPKIRKKYSFLEFSEREKEDGHLSDGSDASGFEEGEGFSGGEEDNSSAYSDDLSTDDDLSAGGRRKKRPIPGFSGSGSEGEGDRPFGEEEDEEYVPAQPLGVLAALRGGNPG
mmetsp:Transcript_41377/g.57650  ORF Transcript_41377/g.57650 Transcript_41377/m.57650 type:complete len:458 (+) Transcript_41377:375-1748(+)